MNDHAYNDFPNRNQSHLHPTRHCSVAIDPKLLEILRCPLTKQSLKHVSEDRIEELNSRISSGEVHYEDGTLVREAIVEGLITANGTRIYRIDAGIPIMLHGRSIPLQDSTSPD